MAKNKAKPKKKVKKKTLKKKEKKAIEKLAEKVTLSLSPEKKPKSQTKPQWVEESSAIPNEFSQRSFLNPEDLILHSDELSPEEQPAFETLEQQLGGAPSNQNLQQENAAYSAATESSYSSQGQESGSGSYSTSQEMTSPPQLTDNVVRGAQVSNPFGRQNLRQAEQITRVPQTSEQTDTFIESQRKYEDSKHLTEETSRNSRVRSRRISKNF
jgi:hypothetical protein